MNDVLSGRYQKIIVGDTVLYIVDNWSLMRYKLKFALRAEVRNIAILCLDLSDSPVLVLLPMRMLVLREGESCELVSTSIGGEIDKTSKNVDRVLVDIGCKISPSSERCSVFNHQFDPIIRSYIESPDIIKQNFISVVSQPLTSHYDQHFSFIVHTRMPCPRIGAATQDLHFCNRKRWNVLDLKITLEFQLEDVIRIMGILTVAPLSSKRQDFIAKSSHSSTNSGLELTSDLSDLVPAY